MSNSPFPQTGSIPGAIGTDARVSAFLRSVYGWMFLRLGITAVTATVVAGSPSLVGALVANRMLFFGLIAAQLGLVFYLSSRVATMAPSQ